MKWFKCLFFRNKNARHRRKNPKIMQTKKTNDCLCALDIGIGRDYD